MSKAHIVWLSGLALVGGCASYSKHDLAEDACWLLPKCEDGMRAPPDSGPPHARNIETGGLPKGQN